MRIEVWDSGPGFRAEDAEQMFSAWYSNRADGTGLGLAVTHRIVRAFGWTLQAERRESRTVFTIRAPLLGANGGIAA